MGVVYLAEDTRLRRTVALKFLSPQLLESQSDRERFLREAQSAARLDHANICAIHEIRDADGVTFIVMAHVEGEGLETAIARAPIEPARALDIARQVALGLAHAHRRGILHRDIKPANLRLTPEGTVKIVDFGLARALDRSRITRAGVAVGTSAYMSPEQVRGEQLDHRSDIFSLGEVLYEMLTGRLPFPGDHPAAIMYGIVHSEPLPVETGVPVRDEVRAILRKCLAKDPAERFQSAEELALALSSAAGVTPSAAGSRSTRVPRRIVQVGIALGVLAAVAIALTAIRRDHRPPSVGSASGSFRAVDGSRSHRQAAFSPDGERLALVADDSVGVAQIWVREIETGAARQVTNGSDVATHPRWTSDGEIVFARKEYGIWRLAPDGGQPRQISSKGETPDVSSDGRWVCWVDADRIWVARDDGTRPRPVKGVDARFFGYLRRPAFSPDGKWIAYFEPHVHRPLGDIMVVAVSGGEPRQLTFDHFEGGDPTWTPDGRWIIYSSNQQGTHTLWRVPFAGGGVEPVTLGTGEDVEPAVSPDGQTVIYTNNRVQHRLRVYDHRTGDTRTLLEQRASIMLPEVSPNRGHIAFFSRTTEGHHLFVIDAADGQVTQITRGEGLLNTHPRWSGDGKSLYFYRETPTTAFMRIDIQGGDPETIVDGMRWTIQNKAAVSPDGRYLVYTMRGAGRSFETAQVRDLRSGEAWALATAIWACRWMPDGRSIIGSDWEGRVMICPYEGGPCDTIAEGSRPILSEDGTRVFFLRGALNEVWSCGLDGGDAEQVVSLQNTLPLSFSYGLLSGDRVLWNETIREAPELWLGSLGP